VGNFYTASNIKMEKFWPNFKAFHRKMLERAENNQEKR
jgi:hypothetical protein